MLKRAISTFLVKKFTKLIVSVKDSWLLVGD